MLIWNSIWRPRFYFAPDAEAGAAAATDPEPAPESPEPGEGGDPTPDGGEGTGTDEDLGDPTGALLEALESMGLSRDPAQFQASLRSLQQRAQSADQYQAMLWQLAAQRQQQQAPAPQPTAAEAKKWEVPWGARPEFDQKLIQQLMTDEQGNIVAKPGAMPNIPQQYQAYKDWLQGGTEKLLTDPLSIYPGFEPLVQKQIEAGIQAALQQQAQQAQFNQMKTRMEEFKTKNRKWTHDPVTGGLTQAGQFWENAFQQACQMGIPDPISYAENTLDATLARMEWEQAQANPVPAAPAPSANPRLDFLKSKNKPGRNGAAARPNGKKSPAPDSDVWAELRGKLDSLPASDFKKNPGSN